jgi:hypothetical protein
MKVNLVVCCALLILFGSDRLIHAQARPDASVVLVKQWLAAHAQGFQFSVTEKRVNKLGDKASTAWLKIFKDEELKDPTTVKSFLLLIHAAFEYPELISSDEDKHPQATLLLLNNLKGKVADPRLRGQVDQLTSFVKEKASVQ